MAYFRCTTGGSGKGNTLVVTCADDLAGATITCTNGTKTYRKTCPSTAPYEVTFYGLEAGTWTLSATVSGNTYTATVVITDCAALLGGFNWRTWVDTAQFLDSSDYNSLDEVLADELAVRELCLEHACVDYLADIATTSADVETIIENDLFAKWVNNSDYALDFLGANTVIKALMDEVDKYGYGELSLIPQVPTMTSNTTPYGEVISGGYYGSFYPYLVFDGNDTTYTLQTDRGGSGYIGYIFPNATRITRIKHVISTLSDANFTIQASNDGFVSDIHDLKTYSVGNTGTAIVDFDNPNTYTGYRVSFPSCTPSSEFVYTYALQFYAWQPKGNVPVMTANNAPYGTAIANGAYTNYEAFRAFARRLNDVVDSATDSNHAAWAVNGSTGYIGYEFANPVEVTQIAYVPRYFNTECSKQSPATWQLEYSDDNSQWNIAQSYTEEIATQKEIRYRKLDTSFGYHKYWRMNITANLGSANFAGICALQFYGRELSVSVPTMTANDAPYGVASASSSYGSTAPYKAFNGSTNDDWISSLNENNSWLAYEFTNEMKPQFIDLCVSGTHSAKSVKIQGKKSADADYTDITEAISIPSSSSGIVHFYPSVITDGTYSKFRLIFNGIGSSSASSDYTAVKILQIYGLDYSEKEFEEGTTKKWLYDHGVELETMQTLRGIVTKGDNSIRTDATNSADNAASVGMTIDLTPYDLIRMKVDFFKFVNSNALIVVNNTTAWSVLGNVVVSSSNAPNNIALDISSIDQTAVIDIQSYNGSGTGAGKGIMDTTELWLE